jgi:hypothetical protein
MDNMTGLYPIDRIDRDRGSEMPFGLVYRVEQCSSQLEFTRTITEPQWVMIDIDFAERLVRKGHSAATVFPPSIRVITTTTIADRKNVRYHLERELEVVKAFKPKCHIPCDRPVYDSQSKRERVWMINTYLGEIERFICSNDADGIRLIPLIKGVERDEREMCYERFRSLGVDYISYYVAQYFSNHKGNLVHDINEIISESRFNRVMLIGLQSKARLQKLPPQVIALAGQRWRNVSGFRWRRPDEALERLQEWRSETERNMASGQCVLET